MPTEIIERPPGRSQEPLEGIPKSPAFNSMSEKLKTLLQPFSDKFELKENSENTDPPKQGTPNDSVPAQAPAEVPKTDPSTTTPQAPKTETPQTDEELPESIRKSPKASEDWKKLKTSLHQTRAEKDKFANDLKALQTELAKLKSTPTTTANPVELEALRKERDTYSEQLKVAAIERHPTFRAHFENRLNSALEKAKPIIGDLSDKAAKLAQLPPSDYRTEQLDKMMTELQDVSPFKALAMADLIRDVNAISFEKDAQLKKAGTDYDLLQKAELEKSQTDTVTRAKQIEEITALSLKMAGELDSFKRGDDAEANKVIDDRENIVRAFFRLELDPKVIASFPGLAIQAAYLQDKVLPGLREENKKLSDQLLEFTRGTPRPGQSTQSPSTTTPTKSGRSFVERYLANAPSNK